METRWRETLDPKNGGGTVQVKIEIIYSGEIVRDLISSLSKKKLMEYLKFMTISTTIQQKKQ